MPGLLRRVRAAFDTVPDQRRQSHVTFSMSDTLCSALAMFSLKYASLLQFDRDMRADAGTVRHNLRTLFGVSQAPCDTQMRDILDPVEPSMLRPAFRTLHSSLQRGGVLKDFAWLEGKYLLAIDGTGHFSSGKISCPHCCVKHRNSGDEFYHQLLPASIVHPDHNKALPLDFEPITADELLGRDAPELLHALFREERVRLFEPTPVAFACSCSRERTDSMLIGLGRDEVDSIVAEQGEVAVTCEFCNTLYRYDPVDAAALFRLTATPDDDQEATRH